jgi:small subunit ribosomal protein S3
VEELRKVIETRTGKKVRINIVEVRQPETNATLIAESIADQLRRRVAYKRAMKQAVNRAMQRGAKGVKIVVAGRLGGAEMCRREREVTGKVPLHTLRADMDYGQAEALTTFGIIGIKVWAYHGEILPEIKKERIIPVVETEITPVAKPAPEGPGASPTGDMTANRTE